MTDIVADGSIEQLAAHIEQDVQRNNAPNANCKSKDNAAKKFAQRWQGIKLSELTNGIKITPNFMLAMLFLAFTAWLFVVYWIRRHEPLANSVLGVPKAVAPTAHQDLDMMNNMRNAIPVKTAPNYNGFYSPAMERQYEQASQLPLMSGAQSFTEQSLSLQPDAQGMAQNYPQSYAQHDPHNPHMNEQYNSQPVPGTQPTGSWNPAAAGAHSLVIRGGREQIQVTNPEPIITSQPTLSPFHPPVNALVPPQTLIGQSLQSHDMHQPSQPAGGIYQMHVPEAGGARLKTVVNR